MSLSNLAILLHMIKLVSARHRLIRACFLALGLTVCLLAPLSADGRPLTGAWPPFVWPISGTSTPDLPQSSAYGPRLRASCDRCYDFHQGIDIPTSVSTTLLAVMTGTVRIAGSHPGYSDGVVQLDHGNQLYTNYIHVAASLVVTGQVVGQGEPVALSGASSNGFSHLHFETRQGSVLRQDAVNPYRFLPYVDTARHTVAITEVLPAGAVWVRVTASAKELDLNEIFVMVNGAGGKLLAESWLNYEMQNKKDLGDPAQLDNPDLDGVRIQPHIFASDTSVYIVDFLFHDLPGLGPIVLTACALDIHGNAACDFRRSYFGQQLFLPQIAKP